MSDNTDDEDTDKPTENTDQDDGDVAEPKMTHEEILELYAGGS